MSTEHKDRGCCSKQVPHTVAALGACTCAGAVIWLLPGPVELVRIRSLSISQAVRVILTAQLFLNASKQSRRVVSHEVGGTGNDTGTLRESDDR